MERALVEEQAGPRWSPVLAWGLWTSTLALTVGNLILIVGGFALTAPTAYGARGLLPPVGLFMASLGLVIVLRSANPIGWLYLVGGLGLAITGFSFEYAQAAVTHDIPAAAWVVWLGQMSWVLGVFTAVAFALLLSPDGHLPSARWRPVAVYTVITSMLTMMVLAVLPLEYGGLAHPFLSGPLVPPALEYITTSFLILALPVGVVSVVVRFRRGTEDERLRLKWVAVGGTGAAIMIVAGNYLVSQMGEVMASLGPLVFFTAIAAAVLRFRLYDVDLIINRALVYGALTALLAAAYLGCVLLLSAATSPFTPDSDFAVAMSTLLVAALFQPARTRFQRGIDRRFYRSRYDAERVVEEFAGTLRDEVDLNAISRLLLSAIETTIRPTHASMWIAPAQPLRPVTVRTQSHRGKEGIAT